MDEPIVKVFFGHARLYSKNILNNQQIWNFGAEWVRLESH
jgi:hypothetical protein